MQQIITQKFPRLLELKFTNTVKIEEISHENYCLFNVSYGIQNIQTLYQTKVNIPTENALDKNRNYDMFIPIDKQSWDIKWNRINQDQYIIGLYYDDNHIIISQDKLTEIEIEQLKRPYDIQYDDNEIIQNFIYEKNIDLPIILETSDNIQQYLDKYQIYKPLQDEIIFQNIPIQQINEILSIYKYHLQCQQSSDFI